jgi:hypothetical protein
VAAAFTWTYLASESDVTITAPVAAESAPAPAPVAEPAPVNVAPTASETSNVSDAPTLSEAPKLIVAPKPPALKAPALKASASARPESSELRRDGLQPQQPSRYVGTLSIDADPGGEVFVDRQSAGHAPLRLANLRAGSHLIWIERDGYHRFTRVVQVIADRVTRLSAELEPIASR